VIAAYVSGHGFGHSTRVAEVLSCVRRLEPAVALAVSTSAPERLYRAEIAGAFTFRAAECDFGLAQDGPLAIDYAGTVRRFRALTADWAGKVRAEAAWLRAIGATLVFGDIPPLAFAAADEAGLPSVAMANFSWDWIYSHAARREPALAEAAAWAASAYRRAELLLRLPFFGDMPAFRTLEDVPLVARRPRVSKGEARRRLGLGERVVLLSFGGIDGARLEAPALQRLSRYQVVVSAPVPGGAPAHVRVIDGERLASAGLGYVDLVAAADAVVTKPGYGIVSDCLGSATAIVYTDRGDFPEYPILVEQMTPLLPCAYVTHEQLRTGDIASALESVCDRPVPPPPDLGGAEAVARRLLERATARSPRGRSSRTS
jgi:hypothetical protein